MLKHLAVLGLALAAVVAIACGNEGDRTPSDPGTNGSSSSAAMGPGLTVAEAKSSTLDGPLLVNGFIVAFGDDVRLCDALAESFPPQCGGEYLEVAGLDVASLEGAQTEGDTTWTTAPVQLLGDVEGDVLTLNTTSIG